MTRMDWAIVGVAVRVSMQPRAEAVHMIHKQHSKMRVALGSV